LPDVAKRWQQRAGSERNRPRSSRSFCVPKTEIAKSGKYDLSFNQYKEALKVQRHSDPPGEIIRQLRELDDEIDQSLKQLEEMLK